MNEYLVLKVVQTMIQEGAQILYTAHAYQRLVERNMTEDEVTQILLNPSHVHKEIESSEYSGKYNYRIIGANTEHSVVVSVYYPERLVVVTVIN